MAEVVTVSSKIPQSWLQLITAKGKPSAVVRLALAQYLGVSDVEQKVNHEGIQEVNPLQLDLLAIQARLDNLEKFVGYTKVYPESEKGILEPQKGIPESLPAFTQQPIAISSPKPPPPIEVSTIITGSLIQPKLQAIGEAENNATMTRAKDENQSQPKLQPIEVDQDATTAAAPQPIAPSLPKSKKLIHIELVDRGYEKKLATFLTKITNAIKAQKLPGDLIALGLRADFQAQAKARSEGKTVKWLSIV